MHSQNFTDEAKQNKPTRPFPVSSRVYKKKDYEYLSTFPRVAHPIALSASAPHEDVELSHERSDGESDLFTTASSLDCATSLSSASSTGSSTLGYARHVVSLNDMEDNPKHRYHPTQDHPLWHHHHHHHHQHHDLQGRETSTPFSKASVENADLQKVDAEKEDDRVLSADTTNDKLDLPDTIENASVRVKEAHVKSRAKAKSRTTDAPAVLPKFGSWDSKNPSSGEAYTLIFRRLRDEKKSGGMPVAACDSTAPLNAEEADEPLKGESKEKEPLRLNHRAKKEPSSGKARTKSREAVAQNGPMRWFSCCKPSVLDD